MNMMEIKTLCLSHRTKITTLQTIVVATAIGLVQSEQHGYRVVTRISYTATMDGKRISLTMIS